jgi:hypothetical protein
MAVGKRIVEATSSVQEDLRTALKKINAQLNQAEQDKTRVSPIIAGCPWVLEQLGRLGAGQLPLEDGEAIMAQALVTEMAHGVNDVIQFGSLSNREVTQTIALDGRVSWGALQNFVGESLEHLG